MQLQSIHLSFFHLSHQDYIVPSLPKCLPAVQSDIDHSLVNGSVYSSAKTPRPIGAKAAKPEKEDSIKAEAMASKKLKVLESLADSSRILASAFQSESFTNLAAVFDQIGEESQARTFLQKAVALANGVPPTKEIFQSGNENDHGKENNPPLAVPQNIEIRRAYEKSTTCNESDFDLLQVVGTTCNNSKSK